MDAPALSRQRGFVPTARSRAATTTTPRGSGRRRRRRRWQWVRLRHLGKCGCCLKEDAATADAGSVSVSLKFKARSATRTSSAAPPTRTRGRRTTRSSRADLRFFVQDVKLIDGAGNEVPSRSTRARRGETPDVALLDSGVTRPENARTAMPSSTTPSRVRSRRDDKGIVFTNGVQRASTTSIRLAKAPPSLGGRRMTWGWLFGHLFIRPRSSTTRTEASASFTSAPSGCTNDAGAGGDDFNKGPHRSCSQPNRNPRQAHRLRAASKERDRPRREETLSRARISPR